MNYRIKWVVLVTVSLVLSHGSVFAKQPESPGNSGKNKSEQHERGPSKDRGESTSGHDYFDDQRKALIARYFTQDRKPGSCPPGLAKKNNGCQPPGQAKKWRVGQRLPADVVYYDLPRQLLAELGRTPEGQKIVRVGTDLLLISIGTGMVIDALDDLDEIF